MKFEKLEKKISKLEKYDQVASEARKEFPDSKYPELEGGERAYSKKLKKKLDKADMLKKIYEEKKHRECDPETGLTFKQMKKQWKLEKKKNKHHNHPWYAWAQMVLGGISCAVGGISVGFMTGYSKTGVGIWGGICMIIAGTFARKRYKTTRSKRIYQGLASLSFICALLLTGFGGKDTYSDSRRIAEINAANRNATTTIAPPTTTTTKNVLLHNVNATAAPIQNASTINGPAVDTSDWPFHYHYPDMAYVRVLIDVLTMAVGVIYIMIFAKSAKETVLAPVGPWPTEGKDTQMSNLSPTHKVHMELPPAYTAAGESE